MPADRDAAYVPREQYERMVALLDQSVAALDIATAALAAGSKIPDRAVLTAKLATATKELRVAVGEAIGGMQPENAAPSSDSTVFHVRRQAEAAIVLATSRTGKLGGWSREARDPNVLRRQLEQLARNTLVVVARLEADGG